MDEKVEMLLKMARTLGEMDGYLRALKDKRESML